MLGNQITVFDYKKRELNVYPAFHTNYVTGSLNTWKVAVSFYTIILSKNGKGITELEYHHFVIPNGLVDLDNNHLRLVHRRQRKLRQTHIISLLMEVQSTAYKGTFTNLRLYLSTHKFSI